MAKRDENLEKKEDQPQESTVEVTELDDEALEGVSGGEFDQGAGFVSPATNENCSVC